LLLRAYHEHNVMDASHDELGGCQNCDAAGSASGLGMKSRQTTECGVNFRQKCAQMKLLCEEPGGKIADNACFDVSRLNGGVGNGGRSRFDDHVAKAFAFTLEMALKVCATCAENVNVGTQSRVLLVIRP
jgi:hypothetical protein